MKKIVVTLLIMLNIMPAFAQRELVSITPTAKVTTANDKYLEGDNIDFKVVGSDKILKGLVVEYVQNGFAGKVAVLVISNFVDKNTGEKYAGTIVLNGNPHNQIMEFVGPENFVRGGEVTIRPNKDVFELWREEE